MAFEAGRSRRMLQMIGISLPENLGKDDRAKPPNRKKNDDASSEVSSYTQSEWKFLFGSANENLSSKQICDSWLNKQDVSGLISSPTSRSPLRIVNYTPSSGSTTRSSVCNSLVEFSENVSSQAVLGGCKKKQSVCKQLFPAKPWKTINIGLPRRRVDPAPPVSKPDPKVNAVGGTAPQFQKLSALRNSECEAVSKSDSSTCTSEVAGSTLRKSDNHDDAHQDNHDDAHQASAAGTSPGESILHSASALNDTFPGTDKDSTGSLKESESSLPENKMTCDELLDDKADESIDPKIDGLEGSSRSHTPSGISKVAESTTEATVVSTSTSGKSGSGNNVDVHQVPAAGTSRGESVLQSASILNVAPSNTDKDSRPKRRGGNRPVYNEMTSDDEIFDNDPTTDYSADSSSSSSSNSPSPEKKAGNRAVASHNIALAEASSQVSKIQSLRNSSVNCAHAQENSSQTTKPSCCRQLISELTSREVIQDANITQECTPNKRRRLTSGTHEASEGEDEESMWRRRSSLDHDMEPEVPIPEVRTSKSKEKEDRKRRRNAGLEYTTPTGKVIPARSTRAKPVHQCKRLQCHLVISEDISQQLCQEFWGLKSHDKQVQYVATRIESKPIARSRKRDFDSDAHKEVSNAYFLEINGKRERVCRETFMNVLCVTDRFVRNAVEKKKLHVSGVVQDDKRGRHEPPHKLPTAVLDAVQEHIRSFPAYVSHYSRAQTKKLYLSSTLNIGKMHSLYLEEGHPTISYELYRQVFAKSGRKFKEPQSDTCARCDKFEAEIKVATGEEKTKLESQRELHQRRAEKAYELKRIAKETAENDPTVRVLIFDLEQCLETPYLKCSVAYYKRQLYTYNLTVVDVSMKLSFCYMWHEGEADRGADEIASCLFHHIMNQLPPSVQRVVLFSDCASGQNRNSHISAMLTLALQEHPSVRKIDHIFLVSGHTRMECDNKHAVIENSKKKVEKINVPSDWYDLVKKASNTFRVVEMNGHFFSFSHLLKGPLVKRDETMEKEKFLYTQHQWFRYQARQVGIMEVKSSLNPDAPFRQVSFLRRGVNSNSLVRLRSVLETAHQEARPINAVKKRDLLDLLPYLDRDFHVFYENLLAAEPSERRQRQRIGEEEVLVTEDPDLPADEEYDVEEQDL